MPKVMLFVLVFCLTGLPAMQAAAASGKDAKVPQTPETTPEAKPVYLQYDARLLIVSPRFAEELKLDPSPVDALLRSDSTVVSMDALTGQLLADAAETHQGGDVWIGAPAVSRDGQAVSVLLAPTPAFVAMPAVEQDAMPAPRLSCVFRGKHSPTHVSLTGMALGGIDLAMAEANDHDHAAETSIPSVRFHAVCDDTGYAMLALPHTVSGHPEGKIALLLVRVSVIRDGVI